MRLTLEEARIIKSLVRDHLGEAATVRLFGSQALDHRQGGDEDLLVETGEPWPLDGSGLTRELRCQAALETALGDDIAGERRVDLVVQWADQPPAPIVAIARAEGVVL